MDSHDLIPIGALAKRTGLAVSAIRYYESRGLIAPRRSTGNQRRFLRSDIRRLSFIVVAQRLGIGLDVIEAALATLPVGRAATIGEWQRLNRSLREQIDAKIKLLNRARSKLDECIGCGCLSLPRCQLTNREDRAGAAGPGPRFVLD